MNNTGIVILAAGNSSRLGRAKQLLFYRGKTLLQHVADEALTAQLYPVVIVTGANAGEVSKVLDHHAAKIIYNENWQQGMATGIALGVRHLLAVDAGLQSLIIAVCDQPFVSSDLFIQLRSKWKENEKNIVASAYANTVGTPVLFGQKYFAKLMLLPGENGAKKLIRMYADDVVTIAFPQGNIDIDTESDYTELIRL